ncbi:MAG: peptidoglycan bridge formation glycyltransferase FemA/FemB family protein [Chloroflexaceae bacterium]|nr:peptidoglycan bridge formation glycyltransferase FemA/FemB family protein [Chloroflexaceae bacterium]
MEVLTEPATTDWDAFVLQHPQGNLLQLSGWGELKAIAGWHTRRIAITAVGKTGMHICAGVQMLFRSQYGVSLAYVPRGPLFSSDATVDALLLAAMKRVARRQRAIFLRLEPPVREDAPGSDSYHTWLLEHGFQPARTIQPRSTILVDLSPDVNRMFAGFSKGHRADIRRAERQGVTLRIGDTSATEAFYAIMQSTSKRAAFGIHTADYYRRAMQSFLIDQQPIPETDPDLSGSAVTLSNGQVRLLLAEQEGQTVAAHMVFVDSYTGYYLYSGATEAGLKSGANHLLQWHALQWARARGARWYDLWGIPDALGRAAAAEDPQTRTKLEGEAQEDPLIGVYRFKKGFGGRIVRYRSAYDQVYLWPLYTIWQHRFQS